jgi:DNA polymerase-1
MDKPVNCEKCKLYKTSYITSGNGPLFAYKVMGNGPKDAKIMFIGEALGQRETAEQKPFVGDAGKLLDATLLQVGLSREQIYATNVVKCRTPDNRIPTRIECKACLSYVIEEINEIKPRIICLLGSTSLEFIGEMKGLTKLRGNVFDVKIGESSYKILPTWHPSYIIRFSEYPERKAEFIKDLKLVKEISECDNYIKSKEETHYELVTNKLDLQYLYNYIEKIKQVKKFTYDIETTGLDFTKDKILCMALSCGKNEGICFNWEVTKDNNFVITKLKEILEAKDILKIAHNAKFDNKFLRNHSIEVKLPLRDTMYMHYLLDENSPHGLKDLAWRYTDMGGYEGKINYKKMEEEFKNDTIKIMEYNTSDVDATMRIYEIFSPELKKLSLDKVLDKIMMPLMIVLTETEYNGVLVDLNYIQNLDKELIEKIKDVEFRLFNTSEVKKASKLINGDILEDDKKYKKFNTNSSKHLQTLFFKILNLTPLRQTKTGYSTDAETLEYLSNCSEFAKLILEYRKMYHDKSVYVEQILRNKDSKDRVHTDYNIIGSVSGRIISSNPNLQNIPRGGSSSVNIKKIFTAEPRCLFVSADYSQIEYKVWINLANDEKGLKDIAAGLDVHSEVCCLVWPHLYRKVGDQQYLIVNKNEIVKKISGRDGSTEQSHRICAKNVVFGLIYGRGIKSLMTEYKLSEEECLKIIKTFFGMYPDAEAWIVKNQNRVKKVGYVNNLFGRYRRLPEINSGDEEKRATALRQCCNTPVQSSASDILSIATVRIYNLLKNNGLKSKLFFSLHDSVKYNVPIDELDLAVRIIKKGLTDPIAGINFPLTADFEIGLNWGEMISYEEFENNRQKYIQMWEIK